MESKAQREKEDKLYGPKRAARIRSKAASMKAYHSAMVKAHNLGPCPPGTARPSARAKAASKVKG